MKLIRALVLLAALAAATLGNALVASADPLTPGDVPMDVIDPGGLSPAPTTDVVDPNTVAPPEAPADVIDPGGVKPPEAPVDVIDPGGI